MPLLGSYATEMRTGRRPGLRLGARWESLQCTPRHLAGFYAAVSWQERERSEGMSWGGKGTSRKEKGGRNEREEGRKEGKDGECNVAQ